MNRPNQLAVVSLDHLVLTVADLNATTSFYTNALGMKIETFTPSDGSTRYALKFGKQKINLHQTGQEFLPKAKHPTGGSADLCFLSETPISTWIDHLGNLNIEIEDGPVKRTGATQPLLSIYIRDPDGNLIEISNPA